MDLMSILIWIVVGGLAGWLASMVMKTDASQGWIGNVVVGIVGAFLGGWLLSFVGSGASPDSGINVMSILTAFIGAVVLLFVLRLVQRA